MIYNSGGSGVTIESLNVTENGTYTASSGKAYGSVIVNVSGSDISTAWVYVANFWSDPLHIDKGTVDPLAQYIYTV